MSTAEMFTPEAMSRWTSQQKEQVLAALAREAIGGCNGPFVPLNDASQRPIAYLVPAFDAATEFDSEFTPAYFLELARRAATPEDAVTWRQMQSLLDADDAAESQ